MLPAPFFTGFTFTKLEITLESLEKLNFKTENIKPYTPPFVNIFFKKSYGMQ